MLSKSPRGPPKRLQDLQKTLPGVHSIFLRGPGGPSRAASYVFSLPFFSYFVHRNWRRAPQEHKDVHLFKSSLPKRHMFSEMTIVQLTCGRKSMAFRHPRGMRTSPGGVSTQIELWTHRWQTVITQKSKQLDINT